MLPASLCPSRLWLRLATAAIAALAGSWGGAHGQGSTLVPVEGTVAQRDYIAPAGFEVVDATTTASIAAAGGEDLPLVIRPRSREVDNVVGEFNAAFRNTRTNYLNALEAAFGSRTIGSREINSSRFRSFRSEFQAANPLFPVNLVLAQTWAKGYDGESTRERLAETLRSIMTQGLIGEVRPASTVFVATLEASDRIRTWSEASSHARAINRSEIATIEAAGQNLRQSLDVLDRGAGGFMTGLLRANVVEDAHLTALLFAERFGEKAQRHAYRPGDFIVRRGETIDRPGHLALAHLARAGLTPAESPPPVLPTAPAVTTSPVAEPLGPPSPPTAQVERPQRTFLLFVVIATTVGAFAMVGLALRRGARRRRELDPSREQWLDEPGVKPPGNMREALIPHLARELKNKLVQALFAQRQALLHNEAAASDRVAILEERLARLQPAIAEKIRGYEQRIQALESELEEKDQETRDLIRAKLVLARKELDAEIHRHHVDWN